MARRKKRGAKAPGLKAPRQSAPESKGTFFLAPMSPVYVLTTGVLLAIPVIWAIIVFTHPELRQTAIWMASVSAGIAIATFVVVRPRRFVVDDQSLKVVWSLRTLEIDLTSVTHASVLKRRDLVRVLGRPWRIVIAGLFGHFGVLWTSKRGWVSTWLTTTDGWVLIERRGRGPLLVSPADPARFIRAVTS